MDPISTARFLSIPTAFLLSGYFTAHSHNIGPNLLPQSAQTSTTLFKSVYYTGITFVAPISALAGGAYAYLAYSQSAQRMQYATAAGLSVACLPWTRIVMAGGIERLIALSGRSEAEVDKAGSEVVKLLSTWVWQNWVRAAMAMAGGMVGFATLLTERT
nr:anthrone oxygenase encc [Quercus suber]